MEPVRVFYDHDGNTLTVWFESPGREAVAEETGDEIVLMKDDRGRVIGFEKLNFHAQNPGDVRVVFETASA
jgi:uncharacterized protein YuzE